MQVSVVIPVRDDPDGLALALGGLAQQSSRPDEIIIVDASREPVPLRVPGLESLTMLRIGPALPGQSRNAGARAARHPWLVFLDAGTQPVPGWLASFRSVAGSVPTAQVIYGGYVARLKDGWDWAAAAVYLTAPPAGGTACFPTSASLCIRREAWERLGGMREDLRAGEDLLFFRRVEREGVPTARAPGAQVLWDLPRGASGHFARLRRYSAATWRTPLASSWQLPVLRMYAATLLTAALAIAFHVALLVGVPLLAIIRMTRNYRRRRVALEGPLAPGRILRIVAMTGLADAATLLGVWDAMRQWRPGSGNGIASS